ncbi:BTAD domain-containing putative transcriptional regulator [Spongiactinospora sp. 9N601]|uniref:AfsR/SARP family transcriptional regulator n=1 Tax=Spongiactinospora sp. 9N601 TaxID=3375149 RepID=UPI00378EB117
MTAVRYGILGPVALWRDNREVHPAKQRSRIVLARLLLGHGNWVRMETLIDSLYLDRTPARSARTQVQKAIMELRALGARVEYREGGYRVPTSRLTLDSLEFMSLVELARKGPANESATLAKRALRLVRGPILDGMEGGEFRLVRLELQERHAFALETFCDAEIELGQYSDAIIELSRFLVEQPYREHLVGKLMFALHLAGRSGEALTAFSDLRDKLAELGALPAPELRQLNERILRHDPCITPNFLENLRLPS